MSRLSRQEMRRDEVREWFDHVFIWSSEHMAAILRTLVGVAVVGLVALAVFSYLGRRQEKSQVLLADGMKVYGAQIAAEGVEADPEDTTAPTFVDEATRRARAKEIFSEAYESYRSTDAGKIAGVYLGEIAQQEGDVELARERWQEFVDESRDDALVGSVWLNLLALDRESGAAAEAEKTLRSWLDSDSSVLPEDVILWQLAVTLEELGRAEEAEETLQRLVDDFPASPYTAEARQRITAAG